MKNKLFTILIGLALVAAILPAYKVKAEETDTNIAYAVHSIQKKETM